MLIYKKIVNSPAAATPHLAVRRDAHPVTAARGFPRTLDVLRRRVPAVAPDPLVSVAVTGLPIGTAGAEANGPIADPPIRALVILFGALHAENPVQPFPVGRRHRRDARRARGTRIGRRQPLGFGQ